MDKMDRKVCAKLVIGTKTYRIYLGVNTIGRNKNAIVPIKNLNVSQQQAMIVVIDETQHFISDLMSSNGSSLNGTKLAPYNLYQLKDNAEIVFGDLHATYSIVTSNSTMANSSQMDFTCAASQTQTQTFYASTTQLIESPRGDDTQSYMSQETEGYVNELETQEANYPLNVTEKIANATPVHDYIFLKPKDPKGCTVSMITSATADCQADAVELPDVETELVVQNENSNKQTDTESTEILSEGVLDDNYHNAATQAITDVIQACDQQEGNAITSNTSLLSDIPIQSTATEDIKESCNASLGKITADVPMQSTVPEDPEENSSLVFNLQVSNKELQSSHTEAENNTTASSTNPQLVFSLSRKSSVIGGILCNESVGDISHTSTSSGIGEQIVDDSTVNSNSDSSNDSIDLMKRSDEEILAMSRFVTIRKTKTPVRRVIQDSDTDSDDDVPIQKTKRTKKLDSDSDSQIEQTQEIGFKRKSVKKLDSDDSQLENSGSETDCEDVLKNVENSVGNKLDDSECIPATQDMFIDTQPVASKNIPSCENVDSKALEGKELLISDGKEVKANNHSSEESFKLGISEYIDSADLEVNQIMSASGNVESQKVNKNGDKITPGEEETKENSEKLDKTTKEQEKETNDKKNKLTNFLIPSQNFNDELYAIGTQRLTQNECIPGLQKPLPLESQNDDIYLMSTQPLKPTEGSSQAQTTKKYSFKKTTGTLNASLNTLLGPGESVDDDVTTQKIDGNENIGVSKENDIFIQPTQCISTASAEKPCKPLKDDDCFVVPTQPLSTQKPDQVINDQAVDEHFHDLKNNNSPKDEQKSSVNERLNNSCSILFEDLDSSQDHVDDLFVIPPQPFRAGGSGMSKTRVSGSPGKSPKNTSGENSAETLSQIDTFVKQSCSGPKPDIINHNFIESFSESLSQIDTFIKQTFVKPKESYPEGLKDIEKVLSETPSETQQKVNEVVDNIEKPQSLNNILDFKEQVSVNDSVHDEVPIFSSTLKDDSETLSQIEQFVKTTTVDKNNSDKGESTKIPLRSTRNKKGPKPNSPKKTVTKTTRNYKRKTQIEVLDHFSESSDDDFMNSSNPKRGKKDGIKQDINQTYIQMIESKNTKIKKSNKNPTRLDELKVTAGSNRKIMGIAESTCVGTRSSKRTIDHNIDTRPKPKDACDTSKPRPGRKPKRQVPLEAPSVSDKTTEVMTSENERSEHSVPPKKRKYTKKATSKENDDVAEASTSVRQTRKKSSNDADELDTTPRNRTRNLDEPSSCSSTRVKRKQKPKVVFTMLDDPQLESQIRQMGGSIVDTVDKCTVLMTVQAKRTIKLLQAIGQGKPICSPSWLHASKKEHDFLDPWDYILVDKEAESKWKFSLKESLTRASRKKLLDGYVFQVLATNAVDILKGAIEVCGGKCVAKCPADRGEHFFVIASPDQKSKYSRMIKQHPDIQIIEPEAVLDGVLRQELRFERHLLH